MDTPGAEELLKEFEVRTGEHVYPISAELNEGLDPVRNHLYKHFFETNKAQQFEE